MFMVQKLKNKLVREERGISSVEMAIIFPLLLMLIFGMMEFGLGWFYKQTITNAAREGARKAIVVSNLGVDEAGIRTHIQDYLTNSGITVTDTTQIDFDYTDSLGAATTAAACTTGCRVNVTVTVPITNLVPGLIPGFPTTLTSNVVMRHE